MEETRDKVVEAVKETVKGATRAQHVSLVQYIYSDKVYLKQNTLSGITYPEPHHLNFLTKSNQCRNFFILGVMALNKPNANETETETETESLGESRCNTGMQSGV